jgi:two-component system CheB/CheR fusion protein
VSDSGIGIPPEMLPAIFNPFEQAERSITRQFGGLGLGLTICKAIVELHGGTIEAHSEGRGKGASFRVCLPLQAPALPPSPAPRPGKPEPKAAHPLRILVVEDHGDTARIMQRMLRHDGHDVAVAGDIATALRLMEERAFDLLLSDLGLPDGSGVDLMRTLREHGRTLPGIALSGYGQEEDIRRSKEAGFAAHLTKPTSLDQLARAIGAITRTDDAMERPAT